MNELNKQSARMISSLDAYTFRKRFVSALRELLRCELLRCGYNAECSSLDKLYSAAKALEEATRYDIRTRAEAHTSAPPMNNSQAPVNPIRTHTQVPDMLEQVVLCLDRWITCLSR